MNLSIDNIERLNILHVGPSGGEVAGFISGGISLLHLTLPLVLAGLLLSFVHRKEYNAATWSAIGRQIQKSALPTLLFSDGGISFVLAPGVFAICLLSIVITGLLPIAGFLTPLPLTDELGPSTRTEEIGFQYVPDTSYYGQGTLPRDSSAITRSCDHGDLWGDCPSSIFDDESIRTSKYPGHVIVNTSIPDITVQPYDLPSAQNTVAGPLDIHYRNWYEGRWPYLDDNASRKAGFPRPLSSFVLSEGYHFVEGLIIDATNGRIGLRNHTMPVGLTLGAVWEEDVLWIEPVTACTNTNLSLHFSISANYFSEKTDGYLQDDGGFAQLSVMPSGPRWDSEDNQDNWRVIDRVPDLQGRADVAAWWNNRFVADSLEIESSASGQRYYDGLQNYAQLASPSSIGISDMNGNFLDNNYYNSNSSNSANFTYYGVRCSGYDDADPSTPTKAYIRCGYLYSVPVPLNEELNPSRRYDFGSNWTQQVCTCASSIKASVQTITFRSNGSLVLEGLSVLDVQGKTYTDTSTPKWALENAWGYAIAEISTFWGLTNAALASSPTVDVVESDEIYLPAMSRYPDFGKLYDTFAAGTAFGATWNSVYEYAAAVRGSSLNWIPSYSGENDYAQTQKWRQLSGTVEGAAKILDLIWMDLAASAVVGTRTGFEQEGRQQLLRKRDGGVDKQAVLGKRSGRRLVHRVGYSNILYAVPATVLGGIAVLLLGILIILTCCGRLYLRLMKFYINQVLVGRAVAQWEHRDVAAPDTTSSQWKKTAGKRILSIPKMPLKKGKSVASSSQTSIHGEGEGDEYAAGSYVMSRLRNVGPGHYTRVQQDH